MCLTKWIIQQSLYCSCGILCRLLRVSEAPLACAKPLSAFVATSAKAGKMAHLQTKGYFLRSLLDKRRIGENCKSRGGLLRELADGQEDRNEGAEEADGADGPFDHGAHVLVHPVEAVVESVEAVIDLAAKFAEVRFQFGDIMFENIQARENLAPAVEGFFFEQE